MRYGCPKGRGESGWQVCRGIGCLSLHESIRPSSALGTEAPTSPDAPLSSRVGLSGRPSLHLRKLRRSRPPRRARRLGIDRLTVGWCRSTFPTVAIRACGDGGTQVVAYIPRFPAIYSLLISAHSGALETYSVPFASAFTANAKSPGIPIPQRPDSNSQHELSHGAFRHRGLALELSPADKNPEPERWPSRNLKDVCPLRLCCANAGSRLTKSVFPSVYTAPIEVDGEAGALVP